MSAGQIAGGSVVLEDRSIAAGNLEGGRGGGGGGGEEGRRGAGLCPAPRPGLLAAASHCALTPTESLVVFDAAPAPPLAVR